jgi:cytochrome b pre-mRNA-processing protein 3
MLDLLRKSTTRRQDGQRLYDGLVSRSRSPVFFTGFAVPDTLDGRFDVLALHAWLALAQLKAAGADAAAQSLTNTIFTGFDECLREQGAGDMGISRKLKAFADGFYGRLAAYQAAATPEELAAALARNLYRGAAVDGRARVLAHYAFAARQALQQSPSGTLDFGPLPKL